MTFEDVRAVALVLPGVEDSTSYGTASLKVRGKFLARLKEDGERLVVKVGFDERDMLMAAEPETFFITEHYRAYPNMLVRLASVDPGTLRRLLVQTWRESAPKTLVKAFDAERGG